MKDAAQLVSRGTADVLVRINRPLRMAVADIESSIWPEVCGLVCQRLILQIKLTFYEIITELEEERGLDIGHTKLMVLIETPRGYSNVRSIASSSKDYPQSHWDRRIFRRNGHA